LSVTSKSAGRKVDGPRTKIVATVGPACRTPACIERMVRAGVDVFRFNFSHGTRREHGENMRLIRQAAARAHRPIAVMQDLQGPRIRTGRLKDPAGLTLTQGQRISIVPGEFEGDSEAISTNYEPLPAEVSAGDTVLLSDAMIELKVLEIADNRAICEVVVGGHLAEHQGINLPGVNLSISSPTEKDLRDLTFAFEHGVDYVALSFVKGPDDVMRLKRELEKHGADAAAIPVVAKIEKPEALQNLDGILEVSDAVMVARGDLGIEMPAEAVPPAQKRIIREANAFAVPVITATQMLESMIDNPRPTRAEASDVANAILDGTDAVMLSGETAIGKYPVRTVEMMRRIAQEIQSLPYEQPLGLTAPKGNFIRPGQDALADAACTTARELNARAIVAFTLTGATAISISRRRPPVPILALTPNSGTYRRLALVWGVCPVDLPLFESTDQMIQQGEQRLLALGLASVGDTMICVAGASTNTPGGTDMLKIHHFDRENR